MRIGLISDTHGYMDERILHHLQGMDEIWHAGDIGDLSVTDALAAIAPLRGVYGNIDNAQIRAEFPLHQRFQIKGLKVWMTHIGGRPGNYDHRLRDQLYRDRPDLFICGHSHICLVKKDPAFGGIYLNPGAAGKHGFHKMRTLLRFTLQKGGLHQLEVVELGARGKA
ncbi:MAG: metallophosphoesterase family protein [Flavobacteriales bacterium]|nr:metallophosphoesterase family protein [Flavobacteriales bacterium]